MHEMNYIFKFMYLNYFFQLFLEFYYFFTEINEKYKNIFILIL